MMQLALAIFRRIHEAPVLAIVKESNHASARVFEKLGFTPGTDAPPGLSYYRQ